ncbi:MAG TPA: extracellular solute-binding protein [Phototrophicaceae bacterium]|nr:extracellular solute-binding protein [Phototrophicaceae bacterium]
MSRFNRSKAMTRRDFLRLSASGFGAAAMGASLGRMSWIKPSVLQAGTPEATEEDQGPDPATMTGHVLIWGYNGTIDHYKAAKPALEAKYPGLQIETQEFAYLDAHANILNALNSGIGVPDLANFDVDYVGDFANGMSDLTERMAPYADKFVPIALKLAGRDGKLLGMPQDNEPVGFTYRKDIFDKYGITEDDLATWEGFVEAGKKLYKDSGNTIHMIAMDSPGSQLPLGGAPHQNHEAFLHESGFPGVFFNKEDDTVIIDTPEAIAGIEVFKSILDPDVALIFQDPNATIAAYKAGLIASQICPAWYPLGIEGNLPDTSGDWRIMRLPALKDGGQRWAFHVPTVTGIPQAAANPDAAWGIMYEAQLTKEAQLKFNQVTNGILVTQKEALAVLDPEPIPFFGGQKIYQFWEDVLKDIPDVYFGRGWVEARAILTSGIEPIMRGDVSVADGLKASADQIRSQLGKN